jgi:hypothetical protein
MIDIEELKRLALKAGFEAHAENITWESVICTEEFANLVSIVREESVAENRALHRKLAAAELDAKTAWGRYENANSSRLTTENQLEQANGRIAELEAQWDDSEQKWVDLTADYRKRLERIAELERVNGDLRKDAFRWYIYIASREHSHGKCAAEHLTQVIDSRIQAAMICKKCGTDRLKEKCPNSMCEMSATAYGATSSAPDASALRPGQ